MQRLLAGPRRARPGGRGMSEHPRGTCPVCRLDVALRINGTVREHFDGYLPQAEQRPDLTNGRRKKCTGSGAPARGAA